MTTLRKMIWERVKDRCLQWSLYLLTGWTERLARERGLIKGSGRSPRESGEPDRIKTEDPAPEEEGSKKTKKKEDGGFLKS